MRQTDNLVQRLANYKCAGQLSFDDINWSIKKDDDKNSESLIKDAMIEEEPDLPY